MSRVCLVLLFLLAVGPRSGLADLQVDFDTANKLYDQGQFPAAAQAYQQLLQDGQVSPVILFNLGNAHFKAARIGPAIAAYRQAASLAPRDPDLRANLNFARRQVQGPTLSPGPLGRLLQRLTVDEWSLLAALPFWAGCLALGMGQLIPRLKPVLRWPVIACAAGTLILGTSAFLALKQNQTPLAVVRAETLSVRKGPLDESPVAFTARNGAELEILDEKGDWYQVTATPRHQGWVPKDQVLTLPVTRGKTRR